MVCQAMSIAMTVVFPVPVASLRAKRMSSGLASVFAAWRLSKNRRPVGLNFGATSVSQMTVSATSIWQKKGRRLLKLWCRQCFSSRAVSGVTPQSFELGMARQALHLLADAVNNGCSGLVLLVLSR